MADIYAEMAEKIIAQQESIIGPIAIEQAQQVSGLKVDWAKHFVEVKGDEKAVIDKLVAQYKELFGQISVEACKEAVGKLVSQIPSAQLPKSLQ